MTTASGLRATIVALLADEKCGKDTKHLDDLLGKIVRDEKELTLRRNQMSRFPFCPDHRDKVFGLPCRQCEIERLENLLKRINQVVDQMTDKF